MTDDGVRCAVEYNCVRWGRHDLPPQAGIGVYERGPDGLLAAARVYDDVEHPPGPAACSNADRRAAGLSRTIRAIVGAMRLALVAWTTRRSRSGEEELRSWT